MRKAAASIPKRFHPEPDDPVDQSRIRQARLFRRLREVLIRGEMGIWVRLDEIELVLRRQPQVDARVAVDREQTVDAFARLLDLRDKRRVEPVSRIGKTLSRTLPIKLT